MNGARQSVITRRIPADVRHGRDHHRPDHSVLRASLAPPPVETPAGHTAAAATGVTAEAEGGVASARGVLASSIMNLGMTHETGAHGGGRRFNRVVSTRRQQQSTFRPHGWGRMGEGAAVNTQVLGLEGNKDGAPETPRNNIPYVRAGQPKGEEKHNFIMRPVDAHHRAVKKKGVEREQNDLEHPVGHTTEQWGCTYAWGGERVRKIAGKKERGAKESLW